MQRLGSIVVFAFLTATAGCGTNTATTDGHDAGSGGRAAGSGGHSAAGGATEGSGGRGTGGDSSSGGSTAGSGGTATGGSSGTGGMAGAGGSTGGGGARASGGTPGSGGSAGRGGAGGGTGGAEVVPCPSAAPQPGGACPAGRICHYEDCGGAGRTVATCVSGSSAMPRWNVTTAPCATTQCAYPASQICPAGQICMVRAGGALLVECVSNTCGSGPISCGCLQSCPTDCSVTGTANGGFSVYCNTCPQGQCP